MEAAKMKLKLQAVASEIAKKYKDFKQHDKARKTSTYKHKRLDELEKLWKEFNDLDDTILTLLPESDTALENVRSETEINYTAYHDQLMLLPETSNEEKNGKTDNDNDIENADGIDGDKEDDNIDADF